MGCTDSNITNVNQSTDTEHKVKKNEDDKNSNQTKGNNSGRNDNHTDEDPNSQYIPEEEAVQYVMTELETTETRARLMVKQVQTDDDSRISNQELTDLWGKVKDVKSAIRAEFREMDLDDSGFVSPDEAVSVLARKFPGLPEESIRGIVRRYDTDDNGKMQYDEFIYFYCNMCAKREFLETDYEILAKENSGRLPANELTELLRKQCVLDSYMARALVEDCDINRDGIINKKEFANLMNNMFGL